MMFLELMMLADEPLKTVGEIMEAAPAEVWQAVDPENTLYIETPKGRVVVVLSPDLAQAHVSQVKTLAREGFYDGLNFYRVVHGFVAQGGDQSETKDKGSAASSLTAEFDETPPEDLPFTPLGYADGYAAEAGFINGHPAGRDAKDDKVWLAHCTGAFAFARDVARDTASTEFYVTLQPQRYLDRNLTVAGRVIYGMDIVQAMPRGDFGDSGVIANEADWTPIVTMAVASDIAEADRTALEIMDTNNETFSALIKARANRAGEFFYHQADYIDLCQMPIPVRLTPAETP
ncbi:peptidylprolyl isomerase [Parvularcula sp. LCG005]|uniref:peptidylprolyl isomerase n=1 Tax=Parvularcula sp. LCG005 TaxID=3078805 RepID=UPI002942E534|nr:peptidylprolyl isomerase [Parvularcula sp. LCG005]WOI52648.1 peptidylprolyl isomerase [Parvularcula sp. LCG005]